MSILIRKFRLMVYISSICIVPVLAQENSIQRLVSASSGDAYLNFHAVVEPSTCDISIDKTEVEATINKSTLTAIGAYHVYPLDILELTLSNCKGVLGTGNNVMVGFSGQVADTNYTFRAADSKNTKLSAVFKFTDQSTDPSISHCNQSNVINYDNTTKNLLAWPVKPGSSGELHSLDDSKAIIFTGLCIPSDGDSGNEQFHAALDITLFFI